MEEGLEKLISNKKESAGKLLYPLSEEKLQQLTSVVRHGKTTKERLLASSILENHYRFLKHH